jgi:hypothetical protein
VSNEPLRRREQLSGECLIPFVLPREQVTGEDERAESGGATDGAN